MTAIRQRSWSIAMMVWGTLSLLPAWGAVQTQTLPLNYGWNAVWLSVEPLDGTGQSQLVDQVFQGAGFTIDVVARPVENVGTAEFIDDPAATFNQPGWVVWYADPASGENDIFPAHGNQAYLVHVSGSKNVADGTPAGSITLTGEVKFFQPTWKAGAYNLLGFDVSGSPTFSDYLRALVPPNSLSGSSVPVVQRLDPATGAWVGVGASDAIEAGQAYWVWAPYTLQSARYAGPIAIQFTGSSQLDFGNGPGTIEVADPDNSGSTLLLLRQEITFANLDNSTAHSVTLTKLAPTSEDLQVYALEPQPDSLSWQIQSGNGGNPISTWSAAQVAAITTKTVTLGGYRNWSTGSATRENLYQIKVSLASGTCNFWLPVEAERSDLSSGPLTVQVASPAYTGLWVGEVSLNSVTSLAEAGDPIRPTTSTLPLELILHFDGTNPPVLLSHVMFMQTKSADENVPSVPVLVVDETKIPYFEGIETRNGKLVGRRIESVAYDLPRKMDPTSQAALASAQNLTTTAAITAYVNAQTQRPPQLAEDYDLTWPLAGALGPDQTLRTLSTVAGDAEDGSLSLDPFHRSNPFRHAYHPNHAVGYVIERSFSIAFDDTSEDGLLRGTYQESVAGLTASAAPLQVQGSITLRRVSDIAILQ